MLLLLSRLSLIQVCRVVLCLSLSPKLRVPHHWNHADDDDDDDEDDDDDCDKDEKENNDGKDYNEKMRIAKIIHSVQ